MNSGKKSLMCIIGDPSMGGLPYMVEPDDADKWPSQEALVAIWETIFAVICLGYLGVKAESYKLDDGRCFYLLHTDMETPEGRVMHCLHGLARRGLCYPKQEVTSFLEEVYKQRGLPTPKPLSGQGGK
jgi:hypothetical protein